MEWIQFKDEMPEDNSSLLICGKISCDPLTESADSYIYLEFVDYRHGLLMLDGNIDESFLPNPVDYWVYRKDIKTPYNKDK